MNSETKNLAPDTNPRKRIAVGAFEMSYVDIGEGDPIVFLHGNPTSSYLWRNIIPSVKHLGRCLAPDLIGMGESSKDPLYSYRFSDHAALLDQWFDQVGATRNVHLVIHDWGSALGFYRAQRFPDQIASVTYMEALVQPRPWSGFGEAEKMFRLLRSPAGEELALGQNVFVEKVLTTMTARQLSTAEMDRYRAPYPTRESRIPTLIWGREIPMEGETDPVDLHQIVNSYAHFMKSSPIPKLFIRAEDGVILREGGEEVDACRKWANQKEIAVPGRHFVMEDSPAAIGEALRQFLSEHTSQPKGRT